MTPPKGSTVHFDLSTPTTSRCPISRSAREGSGTALDGKSRDQEPAAGRALENFGVDSFAIQNIGDIFRGDELVSRRICRVDADQALEPVHRIAFKARKICTLRRRPAKPARLARAFATAQLSATKTNKAIVRLILRGILFAPR